jgi:MraZ protein
MLGEHKTTLDLKGRINIPSKLRDELGAGFYVSKPLDETGVCISVYSNEDWEKLVEKINSLPETHTIEIRRYLFGCAFPVEADKQGRVLIPIPLREFANLNGEAVIVGLEGKTEIWSKAEWDKRYGTVDRKKIFDKAVELGI